MKNEGITQHMVKQILESQRRNAEHRAQKAQRRALIRI